MKTYDLGEVCHIVGGGTPAKDEVGYWDGSIPWASVRDMNASILTRTDFKITELGLKNSSTNLIPAGNVIIASRVGLGKVCLLGQDTAINQDLRAIIPKNNELLDKNYLFWWLRYIAPTIEKAGVGTTVKGVTLPFIKKLQIPIPPITKQRDIVRLLNTSFKITEESISLTSKSISYVQALTSSVMREYFLLHPDQETLKPLSEISSQILAGGDVPKGNWAKEPNAKFHIPIFTNGEKNDGLYGYTDTARILSPSVTVSARGTIGYASIRKEPYYPAVRLISVVPDEKLMDLTYLYYALKNITFLNTGSSIPQLTVPMIKNYMVPVRPLVEQRQIASHLTTIFTSNNLLTGLYNKKRNELIALKKSLLNEAFSGSAVK